MTISKKSWAAVLGLALAASAAGGVAIATAADFTGDPTALEWYVADNATVPDSDRTTTPLRLYDAQGVEVTSGKTADPLPAFAAAGGALRADDSSAVLYLHAASSTTAAGAWPGIQASGTDRFQGSGAAQAPASVSGKPFVRTAGGYSLADAVSAFSRTDQGTFGGVFELRLRTSSPTAGVGASYAGAFVRVDGADWRVVAGPTPEAAATTTALTAPARATYGRAFSVSVRVTGGAGGTVALREGARVLRTVDLDADGVVSIPVGATALQPGTRTLTAAYSGSETAQPSTATARVTVAKATSTTTGALSSARVKRTAAAKIAVTVRGAGLPASAVTGAVTVFDGSKRLTGATLTAARGGKVTITLPRLAVGAHSIKVVYAGSATVAGSASPVYRLTVTR